MRSTIAIHVATRQFMTAAPSIHAGFARFFIVVCFFSVRVDAGTPNALKFAPGNPFPDAVPYRWRERKDPSDVIARAHIMPLAAIHAIRDRNSRRNATIHDGVAVNSCVQRTQFIVLPLFA